MLEANAGQDFGQCGDGAGKGVVEGLMEAVSRIVVDCGVADAVESGGGTVNLARSCARGVASGHVELDDGVGEWEVRKGRFRQCYSRLITQTTSMRYF